MTAADEPEGAQYGFSTRAVHAGDPEPGAGNPVVTPIYQTSTFYSDPAGGSEVWYSRYGNNPNHRQVEERIRSLEGAPASSEGVSSRVSRKCPR